MNLINCIANFEIGVVSDGEKSKDVKEIFHGDRGRMVEVILRRNDKLSKHHAAEPITVLCLGGTGRFLAGPELAELQELRPGTLITLEANVEHEVIADPDVHILVTKFKESE